MGQEWKEIIISDVADVFLGKTPKKIDYTDGGKCKIVKFRDVSYRGIEWGTNDKGFVNENKVSDLKHLEKDDILITSSAHSSEQIGKKITYVRDLPAQFEKVFFVGELLNIRVNKKFVDFKLVYYYFLSKTAYKHIQDLVKGVHLTAGEAKKIPYFVIPILEQKAIIAKIEQLFSELDNGIENLKIAQAKLKIYRQAVLKKAFEGEFTREWREKQIDLPTADELLETIKQEREAHYIQQLEEWTQSVKEWEKNGNDEKKPTKPKKLNEIKDISHEEQSSLSILPKGMAWVKLGNLLWSVKDGPHYSPKYSTDGIPFISGGNIRPNGIDFQNVKYISQELHEELSKRCKPELNDILYTKGGTTGIARVNTYDFEFNVWVHVAVLKAIKSINPFYLQYALNSTHCYRQSQKYTHGVGNQDLGLTRMIFITLPICTRMEQTQIIQEIESRLSVCDKIEETISNSLIKAEALRQSILKKAFEGNLLNTQELEAIHTHPDYESAEKLLKRIKQERAK